MKSQIIAIDKPSTSVQRYAMNSVKALETNSKLIAQTSAE